MGLRSLGMFGFGGICGSVSGAGEGESGVEMRKQIKQNGQKPE